MTSTDELSVAFTGPSDTGGAEITDYEYSLNEEEFVSGGNSSPILVSDGIHPGELYSVRIRAVNAAGPGVASDAKVVVTPVAAPTVTPGSKSIVVEWEASSAATSTVEVSSDGSVVTQRPLGGGPLRCEESTSDDLTVTGGMCTIEGLTDGTLSYTFRVRVTSGGVTSDFSAASSPVSPTVTTTTATSDGCTLSGSDIRCETVGTHNITFTRIANNARLDYLVVGGGGGGGNDGGGGGGGGAVVTSENQLVGGTLTSLTAVVGGGGAGAVHLSNPAVAGETSSLTAGDTTFTAPGGGAGRKGSASVGGAGGSGGSPGGGAGGDGAGTTGTGFSGEAGALAFGVSYGGGGGGGGRAGSEPGSGGDGGGGAGSGGDNAVRATAGTPNTGGGGGGGRFQSDTDAENRNGAAGGSGIVIIRLGVAS